MMIRYAQPNDLKLLGPVFTTLGYPDTTEAIESRVAQVLNDDAYALILAVDTTGQVVGMCALVVLKSFLHDGDIVRILALSVLESAQGQGIGSQLIDAVKHHARQRGINHIDVNSGDRPERFKAHKFYAKHGFTYVQKGFRYLE